MDVTFCLKPLYKEAFYAIITVTVAFLFHHFIITSPSYKKIIFKYFGKKRGKVRVIILQRLLGVLFFGMGSLFCVMILFNRSLSDFGLNNQHIDTSLIWIGILSPVIILMNRINSKKDDNLSMYPQIRRKKWTSGLVILSALSWIAYLMAYEFMFRGFLLFSCLYSFGTVVAIGINVSIYSLVHVPKGIKEAIGAIPLGLVLCVLTLKTGNILIALTVHIVMALSNEWFSLWANPKMKIIKKK